MRKYLLPIIIMCTALISCSTPEKPITLYKQLPSPPVYEFDLPDVDKPDVFQIPEPRLLNDPKTAEFIKRSENRGIALLVMEIDEYRSINEFVLDIRRYIDDVSARDEAFARYREFLEQLEAGQELFTPCFDDNIPTEDCRQ